MDSPSSDHGGVRVASVLARQGVRFLFTLCGGHISPILTAAKSLGIRVVDVRDEATAVFAADAVSRLTGVTGVAAVTAGPGLTNTVTAVKNAQMAQSPVVILGGATATMLKGRGSLQDIDQLALMKPHVKWATSVSRVRDLAPTVERAFAVARRGVPGPVMVECPLDLLYPEEIVREWYGKELGKAAPKGLVARGTRWYVERHLDRVFSQGAGMADESAPMAAPPAEPSPSTVRRAAALLDRARRPLLLVGSQALSRAERAGEVAAAVTALGIPTYLAGMARGLLGREHPLQLRSGRRAALREADLVILAGVPCDFRLGYGRHIPRATTVLSASLSTKDLIKNRRPDLGVLCDPGLFLGELASVREGPAERFGGWMGELRARDRTKVAECLESCDVVDPLVLVHEIDAALDDDSVLVADGGDFVATASYVVQPRGPLRWLDPGVFGTLGVGAGFALGAKLCRPEAEVWVLFGDGSVGYSLMELDTFSRHGLGVIAIVGNDGAWAQIARDQVAMLGDDVGTVLGRSDYDLAAEGLGAVGLRVETTEEVPAVLRRAKEAARQGRPVLVNAHIATTDFRQGSISM